MEHEARLTQDSIQAAHDQREVGAREPLYGLAPEAGGGGPESVDDRSQPRVEAPVEEPERPGEESTNLTWGIIFGGLLLLFIVVAALYLGIGNTYSSAPFTTYPLK